MNEDLFNMYSKTQSLIKKFKPSKNTEVEYGQQLCCEWFPTIQAIEETFPEYKERYERLIKNQESFTDEQRDFICSQIDDWYLEWKDCIFKNGKHRLGYAKEKLKTLICGD